MSHVVVGAATAEVRVHITATATVTGADGMERHSPPPPAPAYAALSAAHVDVAEALRILSSPTVGWAELYKVFEIVRAAVGDSIEKRGLARKYEVSAFTPVDVEVAQWEHSSQRRPMRKGRRS